MIPNAEIFISEISYFRALYLSKFYYSYTLTLIWPQKELSYTKIHHRLVVFIYTCFKGVTCWSLTCPSITKMALPQQHKSYANP